MARYIKYGQNRFEKKVGIIEKISYEPRAYESVDDRSLSWVISQKSIENIPREKEMIAEGIISYYALKICRISNFLHET